MTGAGRMKRLPAAEHSKLAESDPGAYDAYLIARAVDFELMTAEEGARSGAPSGVDARGGAVL